MTATAAQISQLRRMVAEIGSGTYSDTELGEAIERYPVMDEHNELPVVGGEINTVWEATYDLNAAAADIWTEKAGNLANQHDYSADGGNFSVSQAYQQAMQMARHYRSRRKPATISLITDVQS